MRGEGEGGGEAERIEDAGEGGDGVGGEGGGGGGARVTSRSRSLFILSPSLSRAPPVPERASALSPLSSCTGSYVPGPGTFASCRSDLGVV